MSPNMISLFLSSLGLGTAITLASSHWFLAWAGLEISTLAIIPLMSAPHHPRAVEAATKYFLIQATAAATLLFAATSNAWLTGQWTMHLTTHPISLTMALLALCLKIGLAPLHTWMPDVLQGLSLMNAMILSTWQKLGPFALLLQLPLENQPALVLMGVLSAVIGGLGGLNQTQLRKIMAYSSIAHLGWMMIVMQFFPSLTLLTLVLYLIMTLAMFLTLNTTSSTTINTLSTSWSTAPILAVLSPLVLLSLGGLPPLLGFLPKWLILHELTKQDMPATATIMAMSALLSLYFYLRLSYAVSLTLSPAPLSQSTLWRLNKQRRYAPLPLTMVIVALALPLGPGIFAAAL